MLSTTDGWIELMANGVDSVDTHMQPILNYSWYYCFFYIGFIVLTKFLIMEFYIGIIVEEFSKESRSLEGLMNISKAQAQWR